MDRLSAYLNHDSRLRNSIAGPRFRSCRRKGIRELISFITYLSSPERIDAASGNPTIDISARVQSCIDENRGRRILFPRGYTYYFGDIILDGPDYDGTDIVIEGTVLLKPRAGPTPGFAFYAGMVFRGVSSWSLTVRDIHGNRQNQPALQHIFCVAVMSCWNFRIPKFHCREIRGDGIYISKASGMANSRGATLGEISGANIADDGRNLLSIISCDDGTMALFLSHQIGGTIGGVHMPGGFDIEPNLRNESVRNWSFGPMVVHSKGNCGGFQILGKAETNDLARDWNCQNLIFSSVVIRRRPGLGGTVNIARCRDVTIKGGRLSSSTDGTEANTAAGWAVDFADRITAALASATSSTGLQLGISGQVNDCQIKIVVTDYFSSGVVVGNANNTVMTGTVRQANAAGGNRFAIRLLQGTRNFTNNGLTLSIDAPYDGVAARGIMQTASTGILTLKNCIVRDCDLSGWTFARQIDLSSVYLRSENVIGRNLQTGLTKAPSTGRWAAGDEIALDGTKRAASSRIKCIAPGTPGRWERSDVAGAQRGSGNRKLQLS